MKKKILSLICVLVLIVLGANAASTVTQGKAKATPLVAAKQLKKAALEGSNLKQGKLSVLKEFPSTVIRNASVEPVRGTKSASPKMGTGEVVDEHGIITQPAEGETVNYTRLGTNTAFYVNSQGKLALGYQTGRATLVECEDGTVYWKDPISEYSGNNSWIKGKKEGTTITFPTKQPLFYHPGYSATISARWGYFDASTGQISASDSYADNFIFDVKGDSLIMHGTEATYGSTSAYLIGAFWDDDNTFQGYGDCGVNLYIPGWEPSTELITPPAGLVTAEMPYSGVSPYGDYKGTVVVGWDKDTVYIKGLAIDFPNSWIKGTLDNGVVTFSKFQYVGDYSSMPIWVLGTNQNSELIDFTMSYDAATNLFQSTNTMVENASYEKIYYLDKMENIIIGVAPAGLSRQILDAVAGKSAGETATVDVTEDTELNVPTEAGLVNLVINGNGHKVTVKEGAQLTTQAGLEINNLNFDCAEGTVAPIAMSANPDSVLVGARFQTEGTTLRAKAFYDVNAIVLKDCNFSEVKTQLISANKREWLLKNLTIDGCVVQFNASNGLDAYIQWYGNSNNEGGIKEIVVKNSTMYNIVESSDNRFIRYANASNSEPQKAWPTPQFDATASWTMTNNTLANLASNKEFANNYTNKNNVTFEWKNNVFYNVWRLQKASSNAVKNFTAADNAICGVTNTVDGTDKSTYATEDTLLCKGAAPLVVPASAFDFNVEALKANFTPSAKSYAGKKGFGDPRFALDPVKEEWYFTTITEADTLGYVAAESNLVNTWNSDPDAWGAVYDHAEALNNEPIMLNATKEFGPTKGLKFTTNAGEKQVLFRNYPTNYGGTHMYANKEIKIVVPVKEGAKGLMLMTGTTKTGKVIKATNTAESLGLISYVAEKSDNITYGPMLFTLNEGATEVELTIPSPIYVQSIQFTDSVAPRQDATATFAAPSVKAEVGKKFRNELTTYDGAVVNYVSSKTAVATINETGAVTPVAPGRSTITATIYANDTHKQAQATYDVIVLGGEPWDFTLICDLDTVGYVAAESNLEGAWNTDPNAWGAVYDHAEALNNEPIMLNATTEFGPTKGLKFTTNSGTKQVLFRNYPENYGGVHMYANKEIKVVVPVKEGAKSLKLMTGTTKTGKVIKATNTAENLGLISYVAEKSDNITYGPMLFTLNEGATEVELTIPSPIYVQSIQFTDSVAPRQDATATFDAPSVKKAVGEKFRNNLTTYDGAVVNYVSSNTAVATINETGAVTPVAPGRSTITATIYANDTHKQAQATYDVIVLGGEPWDFTLICDLDTVGYVAAESNLEGAWNTDPNAWGAVYDHAEALNNEPIMLNATTEFGPTAGLKFTTNSGTKQVLFRNYPENYGGVHMYANKEIKVVVPVKAGAKGLMLMTGTTKTGKVIKATNTAENLGLISYVAEKSDNITYGPMLFTLNEGATEVELTIPSPIYVQSIQFTDSVAPRQDATATFKDSAVKKAVGEKFRNDLTTYEGAVVNYASSNTAVATINETGAVTPVAPGKSVITATIYANDTHKQAQATYELIVLGDEPWDFSLMCDLDTLGYDAASSNVVNTWDSAPDAWGQLYNVAAGLNNEPIMINATTEFEPTKGLKFTTNAGEKQVLFRHYPENYGGTHMYANKEIKVVVPVKAGAKGLMLMTGTTKTGKVIKATNTVETLGLISYKAEKSDNITYGPMLFTLNEGVTEVELTLPPSLYIQSIQFTDSVVPRQDATATFAEATVTKEVGEKFRNELTTYDGAVVNYTSSNTEIATINETGAVTPVATGKVIITATIYANDTYKQAQASYELTVGNGIYYKPFAATTIVRSPDMTVQDVESKYTQNKWIIAESYRDWVTYDNQSSKNEVQVNNRNVYIDPETEQDCAGYIYKSTDGTNDKSIVLHTAAGQNKTLTFYVKGVSAARFFYSGSASDAGQINWNVKAVATPNNGSAPMEALGGHAIGKGQSSSTVLLKYLNPEVGYAITLSAVEMDMMLYASKFYDATTGINDLRADEEIKNNFADGKVYDLSGRRVQTPVRGNIYIMNGKKFMAR